MSVTHTTTGSIRRFTLALTADADGSFAPVTLPPFAGTLLALKTDPTLGTAPTSGYNIELFDQHGLDVLETVGTNRSATVAESAVIRYPGKDVHPAIIEADTLTLRVSGSSMPLASVTIMVLYGLGYVR